MKQCIQNYYVKQKKQRKMGFSLGIRSRQHYFVDSLVATISKGRKEAENP